MRAAQFRWRCSIRRKVVPHLSAKLSRTTCSTRITRRGGARMSAHGFADGREEDHDEKHFRAHPKYRSARRRATSPSILRTLSPARIHMLIDFPARRNGSLRIIADEGPRGRPSMGIFRPLKTSTKPTAVNADIEGEIRDFVGKTPPRHSSDNESEITA